MWEDLRCSVLYRGEGGSVGWDGQVDGVGHKRFCSIGWCGF
jgi:hypothetical protein